MATATARPKSMAKKGPGKYKVMRGTHCDGERFCATCGEKFRRKEMEEHVASTGHEKGVLVIYGARNRITNEFPSAANGGEVVDSKYDLSRQNTSIEKKFEWICRGKHTPKSNEGDVFERMSIEELRQHAFDSEIPGCDDESLTKEDLLVMVRQAYA